MTDLFLTFFQSQLLLQGLNQHFSFLLRIISRSIIQIWVFLKSRKKLMINGENLINRPKHTTKPKAKNPRQCLPNMLLFMRLRMERWIENKKLKYETWRSFPNEELWSIWDCFSLYGVFKDCSIRVWKISNPKLFFLYVQISCYEAWIIVIWVLRISMNKFSRSFAYSLGAIFYSCSLNSLEENCRRQITKLLVCEVEILRKIEDVREFFFTSDRNLVQKNLIKKFLAFISHASSKESSFDS